MRRASTLRQGESESYLDDLGPDSTLRVGEAVELLWRHPSRGELTCD